MNEYPAPFHARRAFTALAASTGPGAEDATILPSGLLGAWYAVGLGGRFLGEARDLDQALGMLRAAMDADQVWPDVWLISDHGNPPAARPPSRMNERSAAPDRTLSDAAHGPIMGNAVSVTVVSWLGARLATIVAVDRVAGFLGGARG